MSLNSVAAIGLESSRDLILQCRMNYNPAAKGEFKNPFD